VTTPGQEFPGVLQGRFYGVFNPAAARYLHANRYHRSDVILADDFGRFFAVIRIVQLRAAYQRHFIAHKFVFFPMIP
jgi:hypothetical protein